MVLARPDAEFKVDDEAPIELVLTESPKEEVHEEVEEEVPAPVEIKPNPNRESKIKRKATGFVKDPPGDRKCCALM